MRSRKKPLVIFAGGQALGRRGDGLGAHGQHRRGEAGAQRGDDERAPVDVARAEQAAQLRMNQVMQDSPPWGVRRATGGASGEAAGGKRPGPGRGF